jgi:oxaloacetate decarboxylase alpha subunit
VVEVAEGSDISAITPTTTNKPAVSLPNDAGQPVIAPLAGNIFKVNVAAGERIQQGDVIIILEAMKMETEVRAAHSGVVVSVSAKEGSYVSVGDTLITVA